MSGSFAAQAGDPMTDRYSNECAEAVMPDNPKNDPIKFRTFLVSIETQTTRGALYALAMLVLFGFFAILVIWGLALSVPHTLMGWLVKSTLGL